jgi:eukaryotic-like serine/threonine-protein kinase
MFSRGRPVDPLAGRDGRAPCWAAWGSAVVDGGDDEVVGTVLLPPPGVDHASPEDGATDDAGPWSGDCVGPYHLVERLGAGGMGVVWVARDPRLGRTVAVKVLHEPRRHRASAEAQERLRREALALARLSHPNVVSIYDVGVHGRRVFLTMEHVVGQTLDAWAEQGPSLPRVLEVFEQVAAGLVAVHEAGFVHRDLKPANVMIARDGRVLVMDFGLARIHDPESLSEREPTRSAGWPLEPAPFSVELTADGVVMGTPAYMAPEQHAGAEADARADQFALCATLYEVLLGLRPFRGRSIEELARQKLDGRLALEGRLRLPRAVRALLRRGLEPDPSRRYPSMAALRDALARARSPRRRRGVAGAVVGVAAVGGLGWALLPAPAPAPCEAGRAHMATVWNGDTRDELRRAFAATGLPYAEDAAQRAGERLDAYAHQWAEGYARACHAGERDPAVLDLPMRCLSEARASMSATVALLVAADATSVQRAAAQVAGLPPLARCDDVASLQAELAPPTDPAVAADLLAVQQALEQAAALDRAGHFAEGREVAERALAQATALGYEPAIVRARVRVASLDLGLGQLEASRRGLTEAALHAAGIGDHAMAAEAAGRLSYVLAAEFGQPDEALRWARHAEAALERLPPDPLQRARLDSSFGVIHAAQGDYAAALAAFERAYAVKREMLGEAHPEVAGALENVALSHGELGRTEQAEELQQRSLALLEQAVGPRHPDYALSLLNYGIVLGGLGRHAEAGDRFTQALEIFRDALGPRHPMVARTLSSLGHSAGAQDRLRDAEARFREAAEIIEAVHGERHREYGWSLADRAQVLVRLGRAREAAELYARAHDIVEAALGPDHDALGSVMLDEASVLVELERLDEAEGLCARAAEIFAKRFEPGHPAHADAHACRADVRQGQKRLPEALEEGTAAVALASAALGPEHPTVGSRLLSLGEVELELQRYEDARAHLRDAVAITEQAPVGEAFRAAARFALAKALWPDPATREEALAQARAAQEGFASHGDVFQEDVDEVAAWLRTHSP